MVAASQDTTSLLSPRLSDTENEEGGEGKRQNERSERDNGRGSGATLYNRDETMGVSLGPMAQGHIVGVSRAPAMDHVTPRCSCGCCKCDASAFRFFIAVAARVKTLKNSDFGEFGCITLYHAPMYES